MQLGQRYGSSHFHHNIVVGAGDLFVEFFPTLVPSDPRGPNQRVEFSENYFSDTSAAGVYTHAEGTGVTVRFANNAFRGFAGNYAEVYPDANRPVGVFSVGANTINPHELANNAVDAPVRFLAWENDVTAETGTRAEAVPSVRFVDFMDSTVESDFRTLEWWTERATLHPEQPVVRYAAGTTVMHSGRAYRAREATQAGPPDQHPQAWDLLPEPGDDVRLTADSPHAGLGVR